MLLHALQINMILHLVVVAFEIEFQLGSVLAKTMSLQMQLVLEQKIVHLPEFILGARGFRRLGRKLGMMVHLALRKMPEGKAHAAAKMFEHDLDRGISLGAGRTLEVSVLDHRHLGWTSTYDVIALVHRNRKPHGCLLKCASNGTVSQGGA